MNSARHRAYGLLGVLGFCIAVLPATTFAQAGGGRRGGGAGGLGGGLPLQQILGQLDLSADQKSKIAGILKDAQSSMRESMQGLQDATPEERQSKMQEIQKTANEAKEKVEDELTPEQKSKYYPLAANAALKQAAELLNAIKTAAGKMDIKEDDRKQLTIDLDDSQKTLEGYKNDADAVNDAASSKDFTQKMEKFRLDLRKQIAGLLGPQDTQKLMQEARTSVRNIAGGGQANRKAASEPVK